MCVFCRKNFVLRSPLSLSVPYRVFITVFVVNTRSFLFIQSLRTSAHTGVAIPQMNGTVAPTGQVWGFPRGFAPRNDTKIIKNQVFTTKTVMNTRYGADGGTRTRTAKPEEPKSTESTNSTTSADIQLTVES